MSKVETLRALLNQRLTEVVEEVCGLFEITIAEYEDIVSRSKEETEQQRKLLEAAVSGGLDINKADIKQLYTVKKEQLGCEDIQDKNPTELLHIKVESVEHWNSPDGPQQLEKCTVPVGHVTPESQEEQQQSYPCVLQVYHADVQQWLISKEQAPTEQQEEKPTLNEGNPGHPIIKEKQEPPCSSQEGEWNCEDKDKGPQRQMEENREPPDSSLTEEMDTEDCGELGLQLDNEKTSDCETEDSDEEWKTMSTQESNSKLTEDTAIDGSEPAKKSGSVVNLIPGSDSKPDSQLQPAGNDKLLDSSETEDSDDDWKTMSTQESNSKLTKDTAIHRTEPTKKSGSAVNLIPGSDSKTGNRLRPAGNDKLLDSSETEDSDDDWKKMPTQESNSKLTKDTAIHRTEPTQKSGSVVNPVPGSDSKPGSQLHPAGNDKLLDSSETEDSDDDWKYNRNPKSCLATISLTPSCQTEKHLLCCPTCGKKFSRMMQLRRHMKTHSRKAIYHCSACDKQFIYEANLKKHMRSHSLDLNQSNGSGSRVSKAKESETTGKRKRSQENSLIRDKRSKK